MQLVYQDPFLRYHDLHLRGNGGENEATDQEVLNSSPSTAKLFLVDP